MAFYGILRHLRRREPRGIANKILTFQTNRKIHVAKLKEFHQDLEKCGIREEGIRKTEVGLSRKKTGEVKYPSYEETRRTWYFRKNNELEWAKKYWQQRIEVQKVTEVVGAAQLRYNSYPQILLTIPLIFFTDVLRTHPLKIITIAVTTFVIIIFILQ